MEELQGETGAVIEEAALPAASADASAAAGQPLDGGQEEESEATAAAASGPAARADALDVGAAQAGWEAQAEYGLQYSEGGQQYSEQYQQVDAAYPSGAAEGGGTVQVCAAGSWA